MKTFFYLVSMLSVTLLSGKGMAQNEVIPLWPEGKIPNWRENSVEEKSTESQDGILRISGVTVPTLSVYLPQQKDATGAAVMICPGGGYAILAASHEGSDLARWFNARGIAAFVLKYRLPNEKAMVHQHEVPLMDAMQGIRIIRENAGKWNIIWDRIGVMGFSAGGHLAATLSTHFNKGKGASDLSKPNFSILLYPVISFANGMVHGGSRDNLLGAEKSEELIQYYSNELQVDAQTPPAFLVHSMDDKSVPVQNSIFYALALKEKGIQAELHVYPRGGHGYGLRTAGKGSLAGWPQAMEEWLRAMGFMK